MEYLDTRNLAKRLEELESELEDWQENNEDASDEEFEDWEELTELRDLESKIPEWQHGETLIPESEFVDYVEELLKDIGYLASDIPWFIEIDWERTAENVKQDYAKVEYQGNTYLVRN